jgi:membrane-bound serine protease (ClpP class)
LFVRRIWAARLLPVTTGSEALLGARGEAREEIAPEGMVFVKGALWRATAEGGPIHAGSTVRVTGRRGLQLQVAAQENPPPEEKT